MLFSDLNWKTKIYVLAASTFEILFLSVFLVGCGKKKETALNATPPLFEVLDSKRTGLKFANQLHPDSSFNLLDYMYYYNGAGVAAGDFNNDGFIDLFFAANQEPNRIFLNTGDLH